MKFNLTPVLSIMSFVVLHGATCLMLFHMDACIHFGNTWTISIIFKVHRLLIFSNNVSILFISTASNDLQFDFPTWHSQHESITYLNMELCNGMLSLIDHNPNARTRLERNNGTNEMMNKDRSGGQNYKNFKEPLTISYL